MARVCIWPLEKPPNVINDKFIMNSRVLFTRIPVSRAVAIGQIGHVSALREFSTFTKDRFSLIQSVAQSEANGKRRGIDSRSEKSIGFSLSLTCDSIS